jgi:hypothetical protein
MRNLLEMRLPVRGVEDQRQYEIAAPELVKRVEVPLARLGLVKAKLADLCSLSESPHGHRVSARS